MFIYLRFCDCFSIFIAVNQRFKHDRTATYNRLKKGIVEKGNLLTESYKLRYGRGSKRPVYPVPG